MTIAGVILAAGRGRRFGGDKLLARLPDGATVIEQTVRRMAAAVAEFVCVVRADDEPLQHHLQQLQAPWVIATGADAGMSQSLIAGIRHFARADGWLVTLGDMPYVEVATYRRVCQRWHQQIAEDAGDPDGWIAVPCVEEVDAAGAAVRRRGNPVLFGCQWGPALSQLGGDVGGKAVIAAHSDRVVSVLVEDRNILRDIDVRQDIDAPQDIDVRQDIDSPRDVNTPQDIR